MSSAKYMAGDDDGDGLLENLTLKCSGSLTEECVDELKATIVEGDIIFPDSPSWNDATSTFFLSTNKTISPAVLVRPSGTKEVASTVKIGRKYGIGMAVKSGGHSLSQAGLADGGMTIDLGLMRSVCVDPISKTATVDGGAQLGDVDSETALHKLLIPLGVAPTTGMGLVLNGGQGIASRAYGCAADSILSLTLVDANGSVMFVSKDSHPDLFWGMCGAGTAFGVVTKMTLRLYPAEPFVGGTMEWKDDQEHKTFKAICRFMRDVGFNEPKFGMNVTIHKHGGGQIVSSMICFLGDEKSREEKLQFLKPLRDLGTIKDTTGDWSYYDTQNTNAEMMAKIAKMPKYAYGMSGPIAADKVSEEMLDVLVHGVIDGAPPEVPLASTYFDIWGGAMKDSQAPTAFRGSEMGFYYIPIWLDPKHNSMGMTWGRRAKELMAPFATGAEYVNCSPQERPGNEKAATYVGGIENLLRLRELKQKYDPDNIFHLHQLKALL